MGFNTNLIIGTILVSLCSFVLVGILFSAANSYDIAVDPELQEMFDKYEETRVEFENKKG